MGLEKLIQAAAFVALIVVAKGHLPQFINSIHKAQFQLIQESKASKWPTAMLLPNSKQRPSQSH